MVTAQVSGLRTNGGARSVVAHPWMLVGPWYRWTPAGQPITREAGRLSRPVLQKYETADLVNAFLKDPQKSLKFSGDDFVHEVRPRMPPLPLFNGRKQSLSDDVYSPTGVRKLFLDTHKRFYLVVCELHCDAPGFPGVDRDQVCEAGFVVRRRLPIIPPKLVAQTVLNLRELAYAEAQKQQLEEIPAHLRSGPVRGMWQSAQQKHLTATKNFEHFVTESGIRLALQGWVPSEFDKVGAWQGVDEQPQKIEEAVYPLYPLIPAPSDRTNAGQGRTIYFGLVPTGAADVDERGYPRYDNRSLYEIRCFVRRHKPPCPKKSARHDCQGEIVWSRRTESYQLASHFDLAGTSNQPINIQMPDLPALKAQAAALGPGEGAPVRMISPADSNLQFDVDVDDMSASPKPPNASICCFSIPLITIVASFVFRLFLPIVTFIFGLWFLLKLKFCIPPEIEISAGVAAGLDAQLNANIDIGFSLAVDVDLGIGLGPQTLAGLQAELSPAARADLVADISANFTAGLPPEVEVSETTSSATPKPLSVSVTANLEYEERREAPAA